jgi:phosphoribosylformylglycinamidine synthase
MMIDRGDFTAVHDVSGGGVLVALARMALAGAIGVSIEPGFLTTAGEAFGEGQGRYIVTMAEGVVPDAPVPMQRIGTTGGDKVGRVTIDALYAANEGTLPAQMRGAN